MGVGAADRSHFSSLSSGQRRSGSAVLRDAGAVSEVQGRRRLWDSRLRSAERLGSFPDQHWKQLIWIEKSDLKR
jgi:hypothetical protein